MALHVWKRFFAWVTWPTGFGIVFQHSLALHLCFRGSIFRILPVKEKSCFRYAAVVILQHGLPCYYFHVMLPTRIRWIFAAWLCWQFSNFTWVINIYPWFPWYRRHTWSASIKVYEGVHPHPSILIFIPMNILTRMILPRTKFRMEDMMRKHDQPHCYLLKVGVFFPPSIANQSARISAPLAQVPKLGFTTFTSQVRWKMTWSLISTNFPEVCFFFGMVLPARKKTQTSMFHKDQ